MNSSLFMVTSFFIWVEPWAIFCKAIFVLENEITAWRETTDIWVIVVVIGKDDGSESDILNAVDSFFTRDDNATAEGMFSLEMQGVWFG